jgi:hypothetical protein
MTKRSAGTFLARCGARLVVRSSPTKDASEFAGSNNEETTGTDVVRCEQHVPRLPGAVPLPRLEGTGRMGPDRPHLLLVSLNSPHCVLSSAPLTRDIPVNGAWTLCPKTASLSGRERRTSPTRCSRSSGEAQTHSMQKVVQRRKRADVRSR